MADKDLNLTSGSKERVAFDLMDKILSFEPDAKRDRKYFLTLYCQCLKATDGQSLQSVLKDT